VFVFSQYNDLIELLFILTLADVVGSNSYTSQSTMVLGGVLEYVLEYHSAS
jgi:hypothetical protein